LKEIEMEDVLSFFETDEASGVNAVVSAW